LRSTSARHFDDHGRALRLSGVFVLLLLAMAIGVGVHPTDAAPETTLPAIGDLDGAVNRWITEHRSDAVVVPMRVLDVAGKGLVTIPLRIAILAWLLLRRRGATALAFVLAWASSEAILQVMKWFYARGRPPEPVVATTGFSFPSGHATAAATIGVGLVLVLLAPGPARRRWEVAAAVFAFAMAVSRVLLGVHWLSDVVTGVLLGASCVVVAFGVVDLVVHRRGRQGTDPG
jgi:undecaprenyl-diphosphatase